ncbi:MAG: DedA family protein [Chitinophagales bacterium]|nr:DedA family protein [Chitinophagales bacterium]
MLFHFGKWKTLYWFGATMEFIKFAIDFFLHLDKHLAEILTNYGTLTYAILFLIVFVETGLVIMPLLPGDSLLFAAGALAAATGKLELSILIPLLITAALLGDNVNYFVGKFFSKQIKARERILFFKREYLTQTEAFYAKHGGKTVIMARFVPIVRTVAPFVAGAGSMEYSRYIGFCIAGAILWVAGISIIGYQFGNIEFVKNNFELVILGIIFVSVLPIIWQMVKGKLSK